MLKTIRIDISWDKTFLEERRAADKITSQAEAEVALQKKWPRFYERNVELARRAAHRIFGKTTLDEPVAGLALGSHPEVVEDLYNIAKALTGEECELGDFDALTLLEQTGFHQKPSNVSASPALNALCAFQFSTSGK